MVVVLILLPVMSPCYVWDEKSYYLANDILLFSICLYLSCRDPRNRQHVRVCPAGVSDRTLLIFTIRQSPGKVRQGSKIS